mgnify:CR=1 FL=1
MTVDATWSPPVAENRRPKGRRHLLGVAGRVMLEFPPQAESYTSIPQQQSDLESTGYQAFCCRPRLQSQWLHAQEPTCVLPGRVV